MVFDACKMSNPQESCFIGTLKIPCHVARATSLLGQRSAVQLAGRSPAQVNSGAESQRLFAHSAPSPVA
jgi:hypothetical protein